MVTKIEDFRRVLADPTATRENRRTALRFLVHFVEDLHQPVHVGDRGDRGGNDLQVQFFGQGSNLHRVWDSGILEHDGLDEPGLYRVISALATADAATDWSRGTVEDWANESLAAARVAYLMPGSGMPMKKGAKLGQDYQDASLPVARKRLAMSGVRLAALLNATFP